MTTDHAPRINARLERRRKIVAFLIALAIAAVVLASTAQSNAEPVAPQQVEPAERRELARLEALLVHCLRGGLISLGDGTAVTCRVRQVQP